VSNYQRLRALVAEPNWLENRLFLANVTTPNHEPPVEINLRNSPFDSPAGFAMAASNNMQYADYYS
jgi:hypothetical protein